jgi:hypothetical protein
MDRRRGWAPALVACGWLLASCKEAPAPWPGPGPTPPRADAAGGAAQAPPDAAVPDAGADGPRADAGTSGDAPGPDGPPPTSMISLFDVPAPIEAACQRYAQVQCGRWKECTPARFATDYNSEEICRARREAACRTDFLVVGRSETADNRAACADALAAVSCRDVFFNRRVPACDAPPGTLAMGQACFRTSQCARGLNCQIEVDSCGTCQPSIAAGGDCGWWSGGCALGTTCYDDRCLPELKATEACKLTSAPCEAGLECLAQGCAEKTAAQGTGCAEGDVCDPQKGLYCNFTSGLCEPAPAAVAVGERCGTFDAQGAALECGLDGFCYTASTAVNAPRRCEPRADVGQPCDTAMGKTCKVPLACTRGTCVMPTVVRGGTYMPPACR